MSKVSAVPVLNLLGAVGLSNAPSALPGRGVELLAYLHLHPGGVPLVQLQAALWPDTYEPRGNNARILAKQVRRALGNAPDGAPWLPPANTTHTGIAGYRLHNALTSDWAHFQCLVGSNPHQAPTSALIAAIRLVQGQPLDGITRRHGWWTWRAPAEETMIAAVLDAATELTTRALAIGNLSHARTAARIARTADPLNETGWRLELLATRTQPDAYNQLTNDMRQTLGTGSALDPETRAVLALGTR